MADTFSPERPVRKIMPDHVLIASVAVLLGVGLVTLYSASASFGQRFMGDRFYFISRQLAFCGIGILLFIAASVVPLGFVRALVPCGVIFAVVLCILTFIPHIGVSKNGAARWISIGAFSYQPSEFVKLMLPLYLAHIFDKNQKQIDSFARGIRSPTLITTLFFLLIYLQNNFSTAVFVTVNALIIFFIAGVKFRYFLSAAVILAPICTLLVFTSSHRLLRVISFLWPDQDPLGAAYQLRSSILTVGSGGIWGRGLGRGVRKISSVPEIQSDFIFSAYTEEMGFAGVLLFYLIFLIFAVRGYRTALEQRDTFKRLLAFGLVTVISSQALINIAVVSGMLPVTGIPLPFFSAGGSSLATTLVIAGLIVNVSRFKKDAEDADVF
ncbi:MAG: putative lipid II flippase FtsW [Spirochaetaceae bacterium]|jgi:cell division protein FtsW|nr:putative lipid II flippase FtsW [Spirochaetaceae bacterium]